MVSPQVAILPSLVHTLNTKPQPRRPLRLLLNFLWAGVYDKYYHVFGDRDRTGAVKIQMLCSIHYTTMRGFDWASDKSDATLASVLDGLPPE